MVRLPAFNAGKVLTVVRLPEAVWEGGNGDEDEDTILGVLDEDKKQVWVEKSIRSTFYPFADSLPRVPLPAMPDCFGEWDQKSIGGISCTWRRVNVPRALAGSAGPVLVLVVHDTEESALPILARAASSIAEGVVRVQEGGAQPIDEARSMFATGLWVSPPNALSSVCASLSLVPETRSFVVDDRADARQSLGVERLDRIHSSVLENPELHDVAHPRCESGGGGEGSYGPRRGSENWKFSFLPNGWRVPMTWDQMVDNFDSENVEDIPQPARQHVAQRRLETSDFRRRGGRWMACRPPDRSFLDARTRVVEAPSDLLEAIVKGEVDEPEEVRREYEEGSYVRVSDGRWFAVADYEAVVRRNCPKSSDREGGTKFRYVSAALGEAQTKQLITAFFYSHVARKGGSSSLVNRAHELVLFHYLKEKGYFARWMGKYEQKALHIGNGDTFRKFESLPNYSHHLLPSEVLNKLCTSDGVLRTKGSKGSRSKFRADVLRRGKGKRDRVAKKYVPKKKLVRTREEEERMVVL